MDPLFMILSIDKLKSMLYSEYCHGKFPSREQVDIYYLSEINK